MDLYCIASCVQNISASYSQVILPRADILPKCSYLSQIVGHGNFATVWKGKYQGSVVAVKVFPAGWKHKFTAEKEIYELPLMRHAGIVRFLGTGRKPDGDNWLIVLQYAEYVSGTEWSRRKRRNRSKGFYRQLKTLCKISPLLNCICVSFIISLSRREVHTYTLTSQFYIPDVKVVERFTLFIVNVLGPK